MRKIFFLLILIVLTVALSGCPSDPGTRTTGAATQYWENPSGYGSENETRNDSGNYSEEPADCGHFEQPCCQDIERLSPMGALTAKPQCYDYLECIAGYCVEGPDYEAAPRP
jgi:hypothetical protein